MMRYAETNECRMSSLVRHFGDLADGAEGLRHLRFLRARELYRPTFSRGDGTRADDGLRCY